MNTKEKQLAAKMLEMASDEFSNHGCNDVEDSVYDGWTLGERQQFIYEFHEWNGDPENFDKEWLRLGDSTIMAFLAYKLKTDTALEETKNLYRPTNVEIIDTEHGFEVIDSENDASIILEFNPKNSDLSVEETREFVQYLIEYYKHNYS